MRHARLAGTAALLLSACSVDPTQVVVLIDTDMREPRELDGFRVLVTNAEGEPRLDRTFELTTPSAGGEVVTLPATFGVRPRGGDADRPVTITVQALRGTPLAERFHTTARTTFVEHHRLRLDMFLARRCLTERCPAGETCRAQGCEPEEIDPRGLPDWTGLPGRDAGPQADATVPDAGLDGSCEIVGSLDRPAPAASPFRVVLDHDRAYVAVCGCFEEMAEAGVWVVDVADPQDPRDVAFVGLTDVREVALESSLVLVAGNSPSLYVIDPAQDWSVSTLEEWGDEWAQSVATSSALPGWVFVAASLDLVEVVQISPGPPRWIARVPSESRLATSIAIRGTWGYVADSNVGLTVVDLAVPDTPLAVGSVALGSPARTVGLTGDLVLVERDSGALDVLTLGDPASPQVVGSVELGCDQGQIAPRGTWAVVACADDLLALDLSDPAQPTAHPLPAVEATYGAAIDAAGEHAFVADRAGLRVVSLGCLPPP